VTSFTSLHVADTSKHFMYIYCIGLKTNQTLILCPHLQIKAFPCQFFLVQKLACPAFEPGSLSRKTCQFFAIHTRK
jgi:hypothetical protein